MVVSNRNLRISRGPLFSGGVGLFVSGRVPDPGKFEVIYGIYVSLSPLVEGWTCDVVGFHVKVDEVLVTFWKDYVFFFGISSSHSAYVIIYMYIYMYIYMFHFWGIDLL